MILRAACGPTRRASQNGSAISGVSPIRMKWNQETRGCGGNKLIASEDYAERVART
jgi:hypothetical protein